jgi:hypothetical protein|tara:strand:- start:645 stop:833 length:189 start_codon:yes stop_codon:yes gene_type:complete
MKKVIVGKSKGLEDAEQCDIHVVSNQRELLVGFFDWFEKTYPDYSFADIDREVDVDEYLKNN